MTEEVPPTKKFTGKINAKGWNVKDFLSHIGRSPDWYYRQSRQEGAVLVRLNLMIKGLEEK